MKVLIIGSGGREHALAWKIAQSKLLKQLFCAPGNPGTAQIGENVDIGVGDIAELVKFAKSESIDLTVVGPEAPLADGIVDAFKDQGLTIFGPSAQAAKLEADRKPKTFDEKLKANKRLIEPEGIFREMTNMPDLKTGKATTSQTTVIVVRNRATRRKLLLAQALP